MIGSDVLKSGVQSEKSCGGGTFFIFAIYIKKNEETLFSKTAFLQKCHAGEKCQWKIDLG